MAQQQPAPGEKTMVSMRLRQDVLDLVETIIDQTGGRDAVPRGVRDGTIHDRTQCVEEAIGFSAECRKLGRLPEGFTAWKRIRC